MVCHVSHVFCQSFPVVPDKNIHKELAHWVIAGDEIIEHKDEVEWILSLSDHSGNDFVDDEILKAWNHVTITKKIDTSKIFGVTCDVVAIESTHHFVGIEPSIEDGECVRVFVLQNDDAFFSFLEMSAKSTSEIVRVLHQQRFVYSEIFFLRSNGDMNNFVVKTSGFRFSDNPENDKGKLTW